MQMPIQTVNDLLTISPFAVRMRFLDEEYAKTNSIIEIDERIRRRAPIIHKTLELQARANGFALGTGQFLFDWITRSLNAHEIRDVSTLHLLLDQQRTLKNLIVSLAYNDEYDD